MVYFIPPSQRQTLLFAAQLDQFPVLIQGATGTGKGALARWIHENSVRMIRPLLNWNSNETSLSEALTQGNGSTVVLPELNDLSGAEQKLLSHFLKTKSLQGEKVSQMLNTRVIALTSHHLETRAKAGIFSSELLQQLQKLSIKMPPLSERMDEFEDIAHGILREKVRELQKDFISDFSPEVWRALKTYDWPGNLRELRNTLHLAAARAQSEIITLDDLPNIEQSEVNLLGSRDEFERIYFLEILKMFDNDIEASAEMAHLTPEEFQLKIKKHGIELN